MPKKRGKPAVRKPAKAATTPARDRKKTTARVRVKPIRTKPAPTKRKAAPKLAKTKPARGAAPKKRPSSPRLEPLDVSAFPPEAVVQSAAWICLACVLDVFTRHMGISPKTAHSEIKRYMPSLVELNAPPATRPYFTPGSPGDPCPYCGASSKRHARLTVYRIESGKASDALRRKLVKSLPTSAGQYVVLEEKATRQHAFYQWLDKVSADLEHEESEWGDFRWLRDLSRHYLSRKEPKEDWQKLFEHIHSIRRSRRLDSGWEVDAARLFLAPVLFDELLLVQYLVSRSQRAGGLTLEGRYTLPELIARLRNAGYLRAVGIRAQTPSDALEELLVYLSGGESSLKFYYIVDRREFVAKVAALKPAG